MPTMWAPSCTRFGTAWISSAASSSVFIFFAAASVMG